MRDLDASRSLIYSGFTAIVGAISGNTSCDELTSLENAASTPDSKIIFRKKFDSNIEPNKPESDKPCVLLIDDSLVSIRVTKAKLIEDGRATHSLTHLLTLSLTHSLTYLLTYLLTYSPTYSLTHLLTHSLTHSLTYSLTHPLTYSYIRYSFC